MDSGEYVNVNTKMRNGVHKSYKNLRSLCIFDSCRTPKPEEGLKEQTTKLQFGTLSKGAGNADKATESQYIEVYAAEEGKAADYFSTLSFDMNE